MEKQLKTFRSLDYRRHGARRSPDTKLVKIRTEHNTLSTVKTLLTAFLVLLQLGLIVGLSFIPVLGAGWYLLIPGAISIFTAFSVLSSHRSTQSKAVWVLFILVFFCFGFLIYFMSNDKYMYARPRKRHREIFKRSGQYVKPYAEPDTDADFKQVCRYLHNSGGFTPCTGTDLQYFPSGASLFDDVLERLESAEKFVFIEYYAIADGVLWKRIWDVLERKIAQGVEVRIIYDDVGSRMFSRKTRNMMKKAGAQVRVFNRLLSRFTFAMNYRDHRKMFIIDGKTAYTGGSNIADEYINEKHMHGYWKDSGLRLDGEAVDSMTLFFLRQWEFIVRKKCDYSPYFNNFERTENSAAVMPYVGGPEYEQAICKSVFESVISSAKERLYIMTPYFTPDESVMQHLVNKALSGVDVRIILPSVPDKYYV
ncbi:MAG: phospholipase D-like domain-containing protein, partial [Candidatus Coproplasma sp.]